ncbi:MAG: hypothetical protein GY739_13695, partial [Mesoflavibacter sp.]|nr:hypothetical protein [Mesoflavibacter sp.]
MKKLNPIVKCYKVLLILAVSLIATISTAQVKKPFTLRYQSSINGDVIVVGNNTISRTATGNYNGFDGNHDFSDNVYVDIDNDFTTFNSSSANLTNPYPGDPCLAIDKVLLYWAAADKGLVVGNGNNTVELDNQPGWNYNQVKIMLPGQTSYTTVSADDVIFRGRDENPHFVNDAYICVKDITNNVINNSNAFGKYQVANVEGRQGYLYSHDGNNTGTSGGWQLVVVYKSDQLKRKNISFFDGYANVTSSNNNFNINFSGFQTIPTGAVKSDIVIGALEGDRDLSGDRLQMLNSSNVFEDLDAPLRNSNNFFNSRITNGNSNFTDRNPASTNTLGFDSAHFHLDNSGNNLLHNNQTSTTLRLTSNQEAYGLYLLGLAVEVYEPKLDPIVYTATPNTITPNSNPQTVTYNASTTNNGNDDATNISFVTTVPIGSELVQPITGLPSGLTYSYNSSTRELTFTAADGLLDVGETLSFAFDVTVNDQCYYLENGCSTTLSSQLSASYSGFINNHNTTIVSSNSLDECKQGNNLSTTVTVNPPAPATWVTTPNELDRTVECDNTNALNNAQNLAPVASCNNLIPIKTSGNFMPDPSCPSNGTITNTWSFTDACGNTIEDYTQIITIVDTTGPVIDTESFDFTVQCDGNGNTDQFNNWLANNGNAVAYDECGGPITWSNNITNITDDCGETGSTTVTFTATDECGNSSSTTATFTIIDTLPPTIVGFPSNVDNSQPSCVDVPVLSFENYTEETGDGNNNTFLQGEVFRFTEIAPGVDALVNIVATVNTTIPVFDDNSTGSDSFRPRTAFSIANNGDRAYTEFRFDFVQAGTTTPTSLPEFYSNFNDIDGNNNFGEVNWTQFTNSYTVNDPTDLTITEEGPWIVATSGTTEYTGVTNANPQANFTTRNTDATSFSFRVGVEARKNNVSGSGRQHNIEFTCISNYTNAVTISEEITIECDELQPAEDLTATDECGSATINFEETTTPGACENEFKVERTWTATDECGNTTTRTLIINVVDTTPPTFTVPADVTINCEQDPNDLTLTGDVTDEADNCDTTLDATFSDQEDTSAENCSSESIITRTWTLTDDCGNTTTQTQIITIQDSTAPTFTAPADIEIFTDTSCNYNASVAQTGDVTDEDDNCSTSLEATFTDVVTPDSCEGSYIITRTWTLTDDCGNTANEQTQTITVTDNTAPTFTAPADIEIFTDASCNYNASVAQTGDVTDEDDNCSTSLEATFTDVVTPDSCEGSYIITRTWTLTDDCGNAAADQIQTITVTDNTAPTFTAPDDIEIFTDASCNYDASVTQTGDVTDEADNCSASLEATFTDVVTDGSCEGSYFITRTWSLTDDCGNTTTEQTQTITVTDNTAPTFTAPADIEIFTDASCNYDASVTQTGDVTDEADNCSASLEATFTDVVTDGPCEGSYIITRTWSLTDDCGNTATEQTQTITVTDNTAPTFTAPADIEIFTDASCNYDASVTQTGDVTDEADNCSASLEATFTDVVTAGSCEGSYIITRTWSLIDDCGNAADVQIQTITVTDNISPDISSCDVKDTILECNGNDNETIATTWNTTNINELTSCATDNCSSNLTVTSDFDFNNFVSACGFGGTITVNYTVADDCGNIASTSATLTIEDTTPPTFTAPVDIEIFVDSDCNYSANLSITGDVIDEADNCSSHPEATYIDTLSDGNCEGSYIITRTWSLVDDCGNAAADQIQIITVTDNTSPDISACDVKDTSLECNGNDNETIAADWNTSNINELTSCATDNCSSNLTVTSDFDFNNFVSACGLGGTITVNYTVADDCGNMASTSATLTIEDTTAPDLALCSDVSDETIECDGNNNSTLASDWNAANIAALQTCPTDSCDADANYTVTSDFDFNNFVNTCGLGGTITV